MTTRLTDEQIEALRQKAIKWMHPITEEEVIALIDEVRASRSSSGSGEREAVLDLVKEYGLACRKVMTGAGTETEAIAALDAVRRALSSAPPSPDSGERVRALEEALRESRRCGDKLAKELRGWRDTYVSDDEEDPEGWLALDGWAKSSDARDLALSPQGDAT
jgi:hypothetical protein